MSVETRRLAVGATLLGSIVVACSNDAKKTVAAGDCPPLGSQVCPSDRAIDQNAVDDCQRSKTDASCGGKYVELLKCTGTNASCDDDEKLDNAKLRAACQGLIDAWTTCVQTPKTPDGG